MPKVDLKPHFVQNPTLPTDKAKVDYFDSQIAGFMPEVRSSGRSTHYLRYRDKLGKLKQVKIGTPETMSLDEARSRAKALKSQTIIGFDPREELARLSNSPLPAIKKPIMLVSIALIHNSRARYPSG
ncbi:Arm DNA-binding domain-containing protein [Desulfonatronovibrio magnus]|uniref:Arm DNA-binding domain-containing protein n=1 Tax=Desulfonatronovibrio magnus TaxID=698827 RepID=UPI0005EBB266|nr:Arm DNA-binding domain-containing protein [Desulfonatronovibrio magnus]